MKTILDLCSGSGNWSRPYKEAGYEVIAVDWPNDIRLMQWQDKRIHGILAAPPCTGFAVSGAWVKRLPDEIKLALSVVDACFRAVAIYRPVWWALENPVGTLKRFIGPPALWFHPCDFGDPWTKKTGLWGSFTIPTKCPVEPLGSILARSGCKSCTAQAERAKTPMGFANAFFAANP